MLLPLVGQTEGVIPPGKEATKYDIAAWASDLTKKKKAAVLGGAGGSEGSVLGGAGGLVLGGAGGAGGSVSGGAGGLVLGGSGGSVSGVSVDLNKIYALPRNQYDELMDECDRIHSNMCSRRIRWMEGVNKIIQKASTHGKRRALVGDATVKPSPYCSGLVFDKDNNVVPSPTPGCSYYLEDGYEIYIQVTAPYDKDLQAFIDTNIAAEEVVLMFLRFCDSQDLEVLGHCEIPELEPIEKASLTEAQLATLSAEGRAAVEAGRHYVQNYDIRHTLKETYAFIAQYRRFTRALMRLHQDIENPNSKLYLEELLSELVQLHKKSLVL